jgi:ribonuclease P/MRP protein subunit RPP1
MIISESDINKAKNQILKLKKENKEIIVKAQDSEFNRKILETPGVNILLSPEINNRKDKLKQRDSGLNEILCKLATKNKITIGINLEILKTLDKKEKAIILSRIIQNIKLCKKAKCKLKLINKEILNKRDIQAFFHTLKAQDNLFKN